jgi:hypothetical protein
MRLVKLKADIVSRILARVATIHGSTAELSATKSILTGTGMTNRSLIHTFYREGFNFVDLADKYWYQADEHHGNHKWRSKMLQNIMRHLLLNVWVLNPLKPWLEFRRNLANDLIQIA